MHYQLGWLSDVNEIRIMDLRLTTCVLSVDSQQNCNGNIIHMLMLSMVSEDYSRNAWHGGCGGIEQKS